MNDKVKKAYHKLVPKDQAIVDAVILSFHERQIEHVTLMERIREFIENERSREQEPETADAS